MMAELKSICSKWFLERNNKKSVYASSRKHCQFVTHESNENNGVENHRKRCQPT